MIRNLCNVILDPDPLQSDPIRDIIHDDCVLVLKSAAIDAWLLLLLGVSTESS